MRCSCIDIGSNTTALLVADVDGGELVPIATRRAFTLLGAALKDGVIDTEKIDEICAAVKLFAGVAKSLGSERLRVVATHGVREAANAELLTSEIAIDCGLKLEVLEPAEEAHYSFAGAVGGRMPEHATVVVDAGGGSTEVTWCEDGCGDLTAVSFSIGSSSLRRSHLHGDPPTAAELTAAREFADSVFADLEPPASCTAALAVGGGATTARDIVGGLIDADGVERILSLIESMDCEQLAARLEIEWQRARLLPAGLIVLAAASARIGLPLTVGLGGLREGVAYELAAD